MLKTVFFDGDGFVIKRETNFGQRFSHDFQIPEEKLRPFFQNEFLLCKLGKADLKESVQKYMKSWGWTQSADKLLEYWFVGEAKLDKQAMDFVRSLRAQGLHCCLTTNNEKYRAEYLNLHLALGTVFDEMFCSADVGFLKAQTDFWQHIYRIDHGTKRQVLVVDDQPENVAAAREYGFFGHLFTDITSLDQTIEQIMRT